jgi:hypothetical protein
MCFNNRSLSSARGDFTAEHPFVEALAAHAKDPTGHRDVKSFIGELTDQREDYFGRTFARAKTRRHV